MEQLDGEPTEEGLKRYPDTHGWYYDEDIAVAPYTCIEECEKPCTGVINSEGLKVHCGCQACRAAYFDAIEYE